MGEFIPFLEEAIKLELNAAKLYFLFSEHLIDYRSFWYNLSLEEFNHASILKSAKEFNDIDILPETFIDLAILQQMEKTNSLFEILEKKFLENPTIENAKSIAALVESSAGEIHYEKLMNIETENRIIEIFQRLNRDDKNHLERIMNLE